MSQTDGRMDPPQPGGFYLRSTSTVSLNERFSQVLVDQLIRSRIRTLDPVLQQRMRCGPPQVVLLMERERSSPLHLQTRYPSVAVTQRFTRRSVWTRLGGQQETRLLSTSRPPGFWSFMSKYRWTTSFTCRRRGNLQSRLGQRRLLRTRNIQKQTGRTHLRRGGATVSRRRGLSKGRVPTKQQLDAQLDEYMSTSRSRLDAQLDEYMSMAGQTHWD
ncbi:chromatin target of PRMT1 protein-like isoform X2 [Cebidichthys violaceus]